MLLFYISKDKATWCFVIRKKQTPKQLHGLCKEIWTYLKTKGPWATSLTWVTFPINIHVSAKLYHSKKLIKRERKNIISFLRIDWFLFVKLFSPKPKMFCLEIGPVVLEKKVSNFINVFSLVLFLYLSLWKDVWSFSA